MKNGRKPIYRMTIPPLHPPHKNNPALHSTPQMHHCQPSEGERIKKGRDAIDDSVLAMLVLNRTTSSGADQTQSLVFWWSSCRAQLSSHTHTHTWRQRNMTCVNTAESLSSSTSSSSSSLLKVCVSGVLLAMERCDRTGPPHIGKQPHPDSCTQAGSDPREEEGKRSADEVRSVSKAVLFQLPKNISHFNTRHSRIPYVCVYI